MRRTILVVSASALALTACSTPPTNGTATPASSAAGPSVSSQAPGPDGPKVANPIDLTQFKQTPCNALTDTQVKELLGPKVETKPDPQGPAGPACGWVPPASVRPRVNVIFSDTQDTGTAKIYAAKGNAYKVVEPLEPIDGYPLTAYDTEAKGANQGICSVALGTSDTETIAIVAELSEANIGKKDPCDAAREAAIRVLTTVRGGN